MKKQLIEYFEELGLNVNLHTKARGHQGFFLDNRIDISKNTQEIRVVPTLLHEFAHFIHKKIEPNMLKTNGSIEFLFDIQNEMEKSLIEKELKLVTNFVDDNSLAKRLQLRKARVKNKIKEQELIIKKDYPEFLRSKKFKEFDKYIKKSKAKYLLKYDRVKFITPFLRKEEIYTIDKLEMDFPNMPVAFCAYIRLKSEIRKQTRITNRINKIKKYYAKPTELFARLVEGLYIDKVRTLACAPFTTKRFYECLNRGYYHELKHVFEMLQNENTCSKIFF